jgi:putative acetyltransferase
VPAIRIQVRPVRHEDACSFIEVRNAAVRGIAGKDYPSAVIDAWARSPITTAAIENFLANPDKETRLVAEYNSVIAGIGSLVIEKNELRACYVLPSAARNGVGSAIIREIERIASENGVSFLQMDSSLTAESFYKALGYEVLEYGEHVLSTGPRMACVRMRKLLRPPGGDAV